MSSKMKNLTKSTNSNDIKQSKDILNKLYADFKLQNLESCDIKIVLNENEYIFAHKILLEAHSNFFKNEIGGKKTTVVLNDPKVTLKLMKLMLKYLYKGKVNVDMNKHLENFKDLAKKLEIDALYDKLSKVQSDHSESIKEATNMISDRKARKPTKSENKEGRKTKKASSKRSTSKSTASRKKRRTKKLTTFKSTIYN
uniref:BTB domain-containing protein n=1 Tax=Strongyloides venezuelensis TaxID=75913 RepID=A0A0K0EYI9_STRVS